MKKNMLKNIKKFVIYLFTPEDSSTPFWHGSSSYNIESNIHGAGAVKALFWVANSYLAVFIVSLL